MNSQFNQPKGFGEILDHTFRLSKKRFSHFFMILLILMGPIYILEALIQLIGGTGFFREVGIGDTWYEQFLSNIEGTTETVPEFDGAALGALLGVIVLGIVSIILFPVAEAAIILVVDHIRKNEEYTVGSVIKEAFKRFWPILGSTILFALITFGFITIPIIIISLIAGITSVINPIIGILLGILLFIGFAVFVIYFLTRWSLYFGFVAVGEESIGFGRSWNLTKGRTWVIIGLFIIFWLINSIISFAVQLPFAAILGNSVLVSIIINLITLITTVIFSVGYAVIFFDLKLRNEADDLHDMIEDYQDKE